MFQLNHNVYFIMVHALSDMVKYPTSEKKIGAELCSAYKIHQCWDPILES